MSQTVTAANLTATFNMFVSEATRSGFDTTGWVMQAGSGTYGRAFRLLRREDGTGGLQSVDLAPSMGYLGATRRETDRTLRVMTDTMRAVRALRT